MIELLGLIIAILAVLLDLFYFLYSNRIINNANILKKSSLFELLFYHIIAAGSVGLASASAYFRVYVRLTRLLRFASVAPPHSGRRERSSNLPDYCSQIMFILTGILT